MPLPPNIPPKAFLKNSQGKNQRKSQRKIKKWTAWFEPMAPMKRSGPLLVVPVAISKERLKRKSKLQTVISIPRACGNAVRRNRLKRIFKAQIFNKTPNKSQMNLWIRLQSRFHLDSKILSKDWARDIAKAIELVS